MPSTHAMASRQAVVSRRDAARTVLRTVRRHHKGGGVVTFALLAWLIFKRTRAAAMFVAGVVLPVSVVLLVNRAMTGSMLLMDPGTVFYEGMNASASGYAGVAPRIVKDIEQTIPGDDTMHVSMYVGGGADPAFTFVYKRRK